MEVDHFPAGPVLKKPKSHQNKSTHVSAFASMMTCASFWDEFVSMDQEVKKTLLPIETALDVNPQLLRNLFYVADKKNSK